MSKGNESETVYPDQLSTLGTFNTLFDLFSSMRQKAILVEIVKANKHLEEKYVLDTCRFLFRQ